MASEVGQAYISILPSARGFAARLQRELGSDLAKAGKSGGEDYGENFADSAVKEASSSKVSGEIGSKLKAGLATAGAAAGVALAAGIGDAMERERLSDRLGVQLGATPKAAKKYGKIAGDLFANAYGGSMEEVNDAIGAVVSSIGGMRKASDRDVRAMSASVLDFASAFGVDVTRAAQVAGQMVRTGLARDGRNAMDLLFASMQRVPAAVREDLLDAMDEYGPFMQSLGITGEQAMGLLVEGAEKGMYGIDKTGDAVKEFTIRATDMSKTTKEAYGALGINAREATNDILAGGDRAQGAFDRIVNGLLSIEDPADRANTAIALFGTPMEDLSVAEIPAFLRSLTNTSDRLGKVDGAAQRAGNALADNASSAVTTFKRQLQGDFVNFLGNEVIPKAQALYDAWKDLPGPLKTASKWLGAIGAVGAGGAFLGAKFIGAIGSARDALSGFGGKAKTVAGAVDNIGDAAGGTRGRLGKFASFLGAGGPWGLALAGGILAIGLFAKSQADARARVQRLANSLDDQTGAITRNTAQLVINKAQQDGVYENARKVGISADLVTRALLGRRDAQAQVNRQLEHVIENDRQAADTGRGLTYVYGEAGAAAKTLTGQLGNQNSELGEARQKWKDHRDAVRLTNNALKSSRDIWGDNTKATRDGSDAAREHGRASDYSRRELLDLADQMNLTKGQTRQLIKQYGEVPGKVETDARFNRRQAENDVSAYVRSFNNMLGDIDNEDVAINLSSAAQSALGALGAVSTGGLSLLGGLGGGRRKGRRLGGAIRGGTPGRDSVPSLLMPGEHVFTKSDVDKAGGQGVMYAIRQMIQRGEFAKRGDLQAYADGGAVVSARIHQRNTMGAINAVAGSFRNLADLIGSRVSAYLNEHLQFGGGRPLGLDGQLSAGQIIKGQQFARSQAGKPYVWGGVGPGGYDCSGFQSAVYNASVGRYPHTRLGSTATMPWAGMAPGTGLYSIGWFTGSPGHTSGNIGGLGVESRGGDGVVVGSGARSPLDELFNRIAHYDGGGKLRPGWTLAHNGTGRDETVRTYAQEQALRERRRGPLRIELDIGGGRVLTGVMRDEIDAHADFAATTGRMR